MKRVLSLVLILSLLAAALCLPAAARSSDYISRSDALIAKSGTNSISIKTTTGSGSSMTSIGVTTIVIEQSANGTSWTPVRTYSSRYTAAMLGHNVMTHTYTQTYTGPVNYSYRALVTFYAADKNGSDSFSLYSAVVSPALAERGCFFPLYSGKASRARWARSPRVLLFCCVYASSVESSSALMFIGGSMTGCSPGCVVSREIWLRI